MSRLRMRTSTFYLARVHRRKYEVLERFPLFVGLFARQVGDVQLEHLGDLQQTKTACGQFIVHTPSEYQFPMVFTSHPL